MRALALQLSLKWLRTWSPQSRRYSHLLEKNRPSSNLSQHLLVRHLLPTDLRILQDLFLRRFSVYIAGSITKWNFTSST